MTFNLRGWMEHSLNLQNRCDNVEIYSIYYDANWIFLVNLQSSWLIWLVNKKWFSYNKHTRTYWTLIKKQRFKIAMFPFKIKFRKNILLRTQNKRGALSPASQWCITDIQIYITVAPSPFSIPLANPVEHLDVAIPRFWLDLGIKVAGGKGKRKQGK